MSDTTTGPEAPIVAVTTQEAPTEGWIIAFPPGCYACWAFGDGGWIDRHGRFLPEPLTHWQALNDAEQERASLPRRGRLPVQSESPNQ